MLEFPKKVCGLDATDKLWGRMSENKIANLGDVWIQSIVLKGSA